MLKIALESLGCSKNLMDAEIMTGILKEKGYEFVEEFAEADIIIVNTCGFIRDAKQESIDTIVELSQLKEFGKLKYLIVTGCLAQRYADELLEEIPEIDAIVGTGNFMNISEIIDRLESEKNVTEIGNIEFAFDETLPRYVSTPEHMAYLKIGEGCSNHCTYCIIPKLRGKYRSRKIEDIVEEAKTLAAEGVKELVVIAQDTTRYGEDLYGEAKLAELLEELAGIEGIKWIRIMYSYPESITEKLIDVIAAHDNICSYFDMPIQHASNRVLKRMNRRTSKEDIRNKVEMIRSKIPDAVIRTTVIVGFPGETEEDLEELIEFMKEIKFDRLGAFAYSREEDTPADRMDGHMDEEIKEERRDRVMMVQQAISEEINQKREDKVFEVLIEEEAEEGVYVGRTQGDAEEIDSVVYVNSDEELEIGSFVNVYITEAMEYDLIGDVVDELAE
ncbi:30S ribosomal protein S12 methylthiotransferase RimO [Peptacetobacter hiranonis]|uniref:Ribosomal protein uS12 methylthiotransferase RimO n=1 Tax=Peptacetobacter hiranonis (strain DSM 13275 / JCM 10541 / KCTC 15199 / TO-931) TaxID=500633 RepID=B6FZC8_PEPHT|nr:30S ribosomal protein S12 methylthiotransferase RimO [Peptacetobacter hiranonis]EEA85131.1 ribosomal protein S12 methylthiotransferase RimO [Peptacetobacter hiranonis DSM 13275]QEK20988.1 Ribosomal protein S12 methylthiotransferase RimO [Peptacetobacter hiranonis]